MKKVVTGFIALSCLLASAAALSWGGLVDNNTRFSSNDDFTRLALNQSNGIYFSVNSNLNKNASMRIAAEGLYKYNASFDFKENETKFKNIADVNLLKFTGNWALGPGALALNLGRFQYQDFSGSVFSQVSDGAYISFDTLDVKASVYAGYTGLLNRLNVSMVDNETKDDDQFYALCPKYIPLAADISYKKLFEYHTVGLQAAAFLPLSDDYKMKAYGTLILNGYIGTLASYDARVTLGTEKFDGLMLDAKLDGTFYASNNLMVTAGGEYVSGAQGDIKPFLTISSRSFGGAPVYNGVIVPKVGVMYVAGKFFASATERIIITMPKDEAKLDGFDTSVNVIYNAFSDLQLGCDIGAYICKETKTNSNYYATVKASLAF